MMTTTTVTTTTKTTKTTTTTTTMMMMVSGAATVKLMVKVNKAIMNLENKKNGMVYMHNAWYAGGIDE